MWKLSEGSPCTIAISEEAWTHTRHNTSQMPISFCVPQGIRWMWIAMKITHNENSMKITHNNEKSNETFTQRCKLHWKSYIINNFNQPLVVAHQLLEPRKYRPGLCQPRKCQDTQVLLTSSSGTTAGRHSTGYRLPGQNSTSANTKTHTTLLSTK